MKIAFVRTQGHPDRIYVKRSGGGEVSWSFPTFGDGLPHDLVHLVVEAAFGVRQGFWKRVDEGADPARINAEANRKGGPNKYAAFGADQRDLSLSEGLAGIRWLGIDTSDEDRRRAIEGAFEAVGLEVPSVDAAVVAATLSTLGERWRALVPKGAIDLEYDPDAPRMSFARQFR